MPRTKAKFLVGSTIPKGADKGKKLALHLKRAKTKVFVLSDGQYLVESTVHGGRHTDLFAGWEYEKLSLVVFKMIKELHVAGVDLTSDAAQDAILKCYEYVWEESKKDN